MYIEEEVASKTSTVDVPDWEQAYSELKNILESRFFFHRVEEEKFRHNIEKGLVVSKINLYREMDDYTTVEITIMLSLEQESPDSKRAQATIDSKVEVVTRYPEQTPFQRSALYFALRSIWDKLVYGWARGKWKDEAEEIMIDVHSEIRGYFQSMETRV
ncbi:MAG: hypothetical protein SVV03_05930 [Candidatus Nanohaloarchaea archaeon]|nr:hypothetical protein [Candidatus Nanohaloarchaea archaeon]